jgi:small subunit ribosomal protein S3
MGQKVQPIAFRLGGVKDWQAKWYNEKSLYRESLQEDLRIRKAIQNKYPEAGVSKVEIERQGNKLAITIYTSRPGIVIGRGGQRVDEMRHVLEEVTGKRLQLNIQEIREPELDAYLVAKNIAGQLGRHIAYRRAMKQAISRALQSGAQGIKITCSGRLGGAEIARKLTLRDGRMPLHTLIADIDYGLAEAHTLLGRIGVKVWIYKGDILPLPKEVTATETSLPPLERVIIED